MMDRENRNLLVDSDDNGEHELDLHRPMNNNRIGFTKRAYERGVQRKKSSRFSSSSGVLSLTCVAQYTVLLLMIGAIFVLMWSAASMKIELDDLRTKMEGKPESNSRSNSQEYKEFQKELDEKVKEAKVGETKIAILQGQFQTLFNQIGSLNRTIALVQKKVEVPSSVGNIVKDVEELKKGMADSLAGNTKVTSEMNSIKTALQDHDEAIRIINNIVKNLTSQIEQTTGQSVIQPPTALPTLPADIEEKDVIDQSSVKTPTEEMTEHFTKEIDRVLGIVGHVNETLLANVLHLTDELQAAKNSVEEVKAKLATSESNSTETSVSSDELDSIKKNIESLSSSVNTGLQKHNDTIISLATSLNQLRLSTTQAQRNITAELTAIKQNHLIHVTSVNNKTNELQTAIKTNTEKIKKLENEVQSMNTSSQVPEPNIEVHPTPEVTTEKTSVETEQVTSTPVLPETNPTEKTETVANVENTTSSIPAQTEQINSTAVTQQVSTNTTSAPTTSNDAADAAESEENILENQEGETAVEQPAENGEEAADDNPTRVTRSLPEADQESALNRLISEP